MQQNISGTSNATNPLASIPRQDWRTEISIHLNMQMEIRNRVEILWYDKNAFDYEQGFLSLMDFLYKPHKKAFEGNIRLQYFETGSYNSRVYVYENDVLYNFSIPSFYDKGFRHYLNLNCNFKKLLHIKSTNKINVDDWLRCAQTIYSNKNVVGRVWMKCKAIKSQR